jgi:hypothetical protein
MFLMTGRARSILDDVGFVESVLLMTALAFSIDRIKSDAVVKPLPHDRLDLPGREGPAGHERGVMTRFTVIDQIGVIGRKGAGVEEFLVTALLKKPETKETADDRD